MNAVLQTAPAVSSTDTLPVALAIAATVTAMVAVALIVVGLRRTSRLTAFTGGLSAASFAALLVGALAVGGALTQPPTAVAGPVRADPVQDVPVDAFADGELDGFQLPTLTLDGSD